MSVIPIANYYLIGSDFGFCMQSIEDKFLADLQEAYYVETGLVDMLGDIAEFSNDDSLADGLQEHQQETEKHVERLEEAFEAPEVQPSGRENPVFDGPVTANNVFLEEADGDSELQDVHILVLGSRTNTSKLRATRTCSS